jgi:hypothetical protein
VPRQQKQDVSSESSSSVLRKFLDFLKLVLCFFCESFFRYMAAAVSYSFRPSSSLIFSEPSVVLGVKALLTKVSSQTGSCSFVLFKFLLSLITILEGFERPLGRNDVLLLLQQMMIVRENHEKAGSLLLLLENAASIGKAALSAA